MPVPLADSPSDEHAALVLIVDRDTDTRKLYAEYLRLTSCEIDEAADGREALAKALARSPSVVVTETRLPGIDGFELCRLLRGDPATRASAIVFVTGDALEDDVRRARAAGADTVLVKPCLPETVALELRRLLQQPSEIRERTRVQRMRTQAACDRSDEPAAQPHEGGTARPPVLSRAYKRHQTVEPPIPPPALVCPRCDQPLRYQRSHVGGVSARHPEQWDYYECPGGCGTFQYRERTRKLRRIP